MSILLQLKPEDDPVYQFLDKKRGENKPFYVYMTAGGTKFLRIITPAQKARKKRGRVI